MASNTIGDKGGKGTKIGIFFTYYTGILIICFIRQIHTASEPPLILSSHNDLPNKNFLKANTSLSELEGTSVDASRHWTDWIISGALNMANGAFSASN